MFILLFEISSMCKNSVILNLCFLLYPENKMAIEAFLNLFIEFLKDEMITKHGFKDQDFPGI